MALYRIRIQVRSPLITPLKGDTIWGHIVWGIANHEGNTAVQDFLTTENIGTPPLVVSSAFPAGNICRPLPAPQRQKKCLSRTEYAQIKQEKKDHCVPASLYLKIPEYAGNHGKASIKQITETAAHNSINRYTGTVSDGNLFSVAERWSAAGDDNREPCLFDIYTETTYTPERLTELFTWAFENGYGADASTGKGYITVQGQPSEVTPKCSGNSYMALGPFVLNPESSTGEQYNTILGSRITDLCADVFVRTGKTGGGFAGSGMSPYKKTVVMFDEGAVFTSAEPLTFAGCLLQNIHFDKRICQSGFAPVIPITVKDRTDE